MRAFLMCAWANKAAWPGVVLVLFGHYLSVEYHQQLGLVGVPGFALSAALLMNSMSAYWRVLDSIEHRDGIWDDDFVRKWETTKYCGRIGYRVARRLWDADIARPRANASLV
jgi:hypothetical protein